MIHPFAANTAMPVEGEGLLLDVLPWLGLILLLVIVLVATIYLGRRLLRDTDDDAAEPFTLQSLRDLHAAGHMTDEEYQRARDAMIGRVKSAAERKDENESDDERVTDGDAGDDNADEDADEDAPPDESASGDESRLHRRDDADNDTSDKPDRDRPA